MADISKSFAKLCHSYIKLADKFQQLDVDYMTLKGKIVPVLKQLKAYRTTIEALKQEKKDLKAELETVSAKYEELKVFEELLSPEMQALIDEAQEQVDLVDETLTEMEQDDDPDLSEDDKAILRVFRDNPDAFTLPDLGSASSSSASSSSAPSTSGNGYSNGNNNLYSLNSDRYETIAP
ncbi:MAG: hypothetical protein AAGA75_24025 [Cyanobacteria bacterium P01_E01_bin.6]